MRSVQIHVTGLVQGVFFRVYTEKKARSLALKGTVCNLPDGSVKIEATGESEAIEKLIGWCRNEGSPSSKVEEVSVTEMTTPTDVKDFHIVRGT